MIKKLLTSAVIAAALFSASAQAENLRIPATGVPAATIVSPDEWAALVTDRNGILLYTADHSASLTVTIETERGALDAMAAKMMKKLGNTPPKSIGAITVSGFHGSMYDSSRAGNVYPTKSRLILVRIDDAHVATALLITLARMDAKHYAIAKGALDTLKLTAK